MTVSFWRLCHLCLALVSCVFIALAAGTGIILAFEPVAQQWKPYAIQGLDNVTLARVIPAIKKSYPEIIDLKTENNRFVMVNAIDKDGKQQHIYIEPASGKPLGKVEQQSTFFKNVTTLHRSLFMHGLGRLFVGISSFLLILIAISGLVLLIQRQGGMKLLFSRLVKDSFAQYYHVYLGRLTLLPILIIAATGTYLCLEHLKLWPAEKITHQLKFDALPADATGQAQEEPSVFKTIPLSDVQSIEFPFSTDPEDYYTLKLSDRELVVNQYSGAVLSEIVYKNRTLLSGWSMDLHTGRKSILWALVLAVASVNILFFIWSGFAITLKRRSTKIKNKYSKDNSSYVILAGSENGTTLRFASAIHGQLIRNGHSSYLTELNAYTTFANAEHIIVITSTHGQGQAPANANKFLSVIDHIKQPGTIKFSVVGFGSRAYPHFCRFARDVHQALSRQKGATALLEMSTVSDQSVEDFASWARQWSARSGIALSVEQEMERISSRPKQAFKVLGKTEAGEEQKTFLLRLKAPAGLRIRSGDLLAVYPANDHRERLYSVAKIGKDIHLSVRLHPGGLGSGYLHGLTKDQVFRARLIVNKGFHFPRGTKKAVLISNGTGIAPFLGMIDQNSGNASIHLYCGFRHYASLELYEASLKKSLACNKLEQLHVAYSREAEKQYVKDLLARDAAFIAHTLNTKGVMMICGSLEMQNDVLRLLDSICRDINGRSVAFYEKENQLLTDCY